MKYKVRHTTRYDYSETVPICYNRAHLTPRDTASQRVGEHRVEVGPVNAIFAAPRVDYFGNEVAYFTVQEPHNSLEITLHATVDVQTPDPVLLTNSPAWDTVPASLVGTPDMRTLNAYQFSFDSRFVAASPLLRAYALPSFPPGRPILDATMDLTSRIYSDFTYDPLATTVSTPLNEVMERRRGVCQDFAHLQIGCLRSIGLAARYVSGYIFSETGGGEAQSLTGAQSSHAWLAAYCPTHGWIDFDPTNNIMPMNQHITVAWGRDYDDVSPVRGVVLGGGEHAITVEVKITPEHN
ncbi:MAG TPA: transglutaminase family protein [Candidatus Hydrogenedentes bacterium]|nr:transglutaminase family protein [Candidatus Hydrogenedentota bacterium]